MTKFKKGDRVRLARHNLDETAGPRDQYKGIGIVSGEFFTDNTRSFCRTSVKVIFDGGWDFIACSEDLEYADDLMAGADDPMAGAKGRADDNLRGVFG